MLCATHPGRKVTRTASEVQIGGAKDFHKFSPKLIADLSTGP